MVTLSAELRHYRPPAAISAALSTHRRQFSPVTGGSSRLSPAAISAQSTGNFCRL